MTPFFPAMVSLLPSVEQCSPLKTCLQYINYSSSPPLRSLLLHTNNPPPKFGRQRPNLSKNPLRLWLSPPPFFLSWPSWLSYSSTSPPQPRSFPQPMPRSSFLVPNQRFSVLYSVSAVTTPPQAPWTLHVTWLSQLSSQTRRVSALLYPRRLCYPMQLFALSLVPLLHARTFFRFIQSLSSEWSFWHASTVRLGKPPAVAASQRPAKLRGTSVKSVRQFRVTWWCGGGWRSRFMRGAEDGEY